MPHPDQTSAFLHNVDRLGEKLGQSLKKLESETSGRSGLSANFKKEVKSESEALQLCERAMERLAADYVFNLHNLQQTQSRTEALTYLNEAETLWRKEAETIRQFDGEGQEVTFLKEMREHTLRIYETELDKVSAECQVASSKEGVALCIGLLMAMDGVYEELGYDPDHKLRYRLRTIAKAFQRVD